MTDHEHSQRAAVVAEARSWIGTPYHHRGRVKGAGVDCAMLPAEVYAACGLIPRLDVEYYPPDWHMHRSAQRYLERVMEYAEEVADPLPGDMAMYFYGQAFAHGAIVIGWPGIIHAVLNAQVMEDDGTAPHLALGKGRAVRDHKFYRLRSWTGQ